MKSFKFLRGFERESFLPRILRVDATARSISQDLIPVVPMDPPRGILGIMNPLIGMSHRYINQENQGQ